jgi:hypothetical protein
LARSTLLKQPRKPRGPNKPKLLSAKGVSGGDPLDFEEEAFNPSMAKQMRKEHKLNVPLLDASGNGIGTARID